MLSKSLDPSTPGLVALHRFVAARAFYPLLLCTGLAFAFFITRALLSGEVRYRFLIFNLFLAWIPYWCTLWIDHSDRCGALSRKRLVLAGLLWLVMFPNAPYIVTDFVHLRSIHPLPIWYEIGLITTFALTGLFLAAASLRMMHDVVRRRSGYVIGWLFVVAVAFLSGYGVYLGRIRRFNSWDVLFQPGRLAARVFNGLLDPFAHSRTIGVTLMFGAMMLVTYLMFAAAGPRDTNET